MRPFALRSKLVITPTAWNIAETGFKLAELGKQRLSGSHEDEPRENSIRHEAGHLLILLLSDKTQPVSISITKVSSATRRALKPLISIHGNSIGTREKLTAAEIQAIHIGQKNEEPEETTKTRAHLILASLAGEAATQKPLEIYSSNHSHDLQRAIENIKTYTTSDPTRPITEIYSSLRQFMEKHETALSILAQFIEEHSQVSNDPTLQQKLKNLLGQNFWQTLQTDYELLIDKTVAILKKTKHDQATR